MYGNGFSLLIRDRHITRCRVLRDPGSGNKIGRRTQGEAEGASRGVLRAKKVGSMDLVPVQVEVPLILRVQTLHAVVGGY